MKAAIPLVLSALAALAIVAVEARPIDGRAIRVIDGDTFALPDGERIRLLGVDAPETRRAHCPAMAAAGRRAKARLAAILSPGPVRIYRVDVDLFGRTLATVDTPSGDAGAVLVEEGLALIWRRGPDAKAKRIAHWCGENYPLQSRTRT